MHRMMHLLLLLLLAALPLQAQPPPPAPPPAGLQYGDAVSGQLTADASAVYSFYAAVGDSLRVTLVCPCRETTPDGTTVLALPLLRLVAPSGTTLAERTPVLTGAATALPPLVVDGDTVLDGTRWLSAPESGEYRLEVRIVTQQPEGQRFTLRLDGLYGNSGEWYISPPTIDFLNDIIYNDSGDAPQIYGSGIPGWTAIDSIWRTPIDPAGAAVGRGYFAPVSGSTPELQQDIGVFTFETLIDASEMGFFFAFSVRNGTPLLSEEPDAMQVQVEFRDESRNTLLGSYDSGLIENARDWRTFTTTFLAAPDTRYLRLRLLVERRGAQLDARFDELTLVPVQRAIQLRAAWANGATLLGFDAPRYSSIDGRLLWTMYWSSSASITGESGFTVQLYDARATLLAETTYSFPYRVWEPGQLYLPTPRFYTDISAPGDYRVRVVWNDLTSGEVIPLETGATAFEFVYTVPEPEDDEDGAG